MALVESEYRTGDCSWCGDHGTLFADNGRCEQCDSDVIRCSICKEDRHRDDPCRHVFQDSEFEWRGSGVRAVDDDLKKPFFKLLDLMAAGFASDLRKAIRSGKFYTWICAPLIGSGGTLELHGMPSREGRLMQFEWGDAMIALGENEYAEETAGAYHWLASLYERKTLKANRATIEWIDEWLASPPAREKGAGE